MPNDCDEAANILPSTTSQTCGFCGRPSWFTRRASAVTGTYSRYRQTYAVLSALYQCSGCHRASLFLYLLGDSRDATPQFEIAFPSAIALAKEFIPEDIEEDRREAWNCYHGGQYKAAILMARTALQRAVRTLTGTRGSLNNELDALVDEGIITQQLRRNADEVRLTGNDVAHPEEMSSVTQQDADDSLTFLDDFLETTLAIPQRQRDRAEQRDQRAEKAGSSQAEADGSHS